MPRFLPTLVVLILSLGFTLRAQAQTDSFASVPAEVLTFHQQLHGDHCVYGKDYEDNSIGGVASAHPVGKIWVVYVIPCFPGAYQTGYFAYAAKTDRTQISQLLFLDWTSKVGIYATPSLSDVTFDQARGIMTSVHYGRSINDCGGAARFQFVADDYDGGVLVKTLEIRAKEKCDGKMSRWPVVYK